MRNCRNKTAFKGLGYSMPVVALSLVLFLAGGPASATVWCGENGMVRFSFVEGDDLVDVFESPAPVGGVTGVDVYAWLTDVDLVAYKGEQFLRMGGFELELTIEGAEGFILSQEFSEKALNVGSKNGTIAAGLVTGQRLQEGRTLLVKWQIMFQGRPQNVRFGLDPEGSRTCGKSEECAEAAPAMIYVGVQNSDTIGAMFGAGYVPAWLNPSGEPDRTPIHAKQSYQDIGLYQKK